MITLEAMRAAWPQIGLRMLAVGHALPAAGPVPNSYMEKLVDTSDEWIVSRTGIKERYFCSGQQNVELAEAAAREAMARAGVEVERPAREVRIFILKIKELALPKVQLEVVCSSGTYIRSLFHDIGTKLGVFGHMSALERLAVGPFDCQQALPLADAEVRLQAGDYSILQPLEIGVEHLPLIELQTENDFQHALHGREIMLGLSEAEAPACRVVYQGRLVGIGETCYEAQGCACNEMLLLHMDKVLL